MLEAISFIRKRLSQLGTIAIGFSGGKDSIVTAELMKLSGVPYQLYFSQTGIDPPEIIKFIRKYYPECIFVRPRRSFLHDITTQNPPAGFSRWCCKLLKKDPLDKLRQVFWVNGIRKCESPKRSKYSRINVFIKRHQIHYYPIFYWKNPKVWEFINTRNLPYPSLYNEDFERIGCIICPYHSYDFHQYCRSRWPGYFRAFENQVKKWYYKRQRQGRNMYHDSPEAFLEDWYHRQVRYYIH